MADCGMFDAECKIKEFAASAIGDQLAKTADAVLELVGKAIGAIGTMWVNVGTPILTGGGGTSGVTPGESAANSGGIDTVLGYTAWIALGVCVLSLMVAGARMTLPSRHGAHQHSERIGTVLISTILISGAVSLATAIAPSARSTGSPAVAFIQDSLWWYTIAFAAFGIIVGAARMAWEQRADAGKDLVRSLMTLAVVTGAGLTTITLLVAAGDSFSVWLINGSLECNITDSNATCFGGNMADLLALTTNPTVGGLGAIGIILFGILAVAGSAIQVVLMVVRSGMLVLLAGMLPITAAATNTSVGQNMFRKTLGWLLAAILYKPAAAIVYATAFKLAGTNVFKDDGSGFTSVVVGLTMVALALLALPALMKLIIPAVSSVSSGGAGAMTAMAMMPSGAAAAGRLAGGGGGGGGSTSAPSGASASGATPSSGGGPGAPGSTGPAGSGGSSPTAGGSSAGGVTGAGAPGASAGSGAASGAGASAAGAGAAGAGAGAGAGGAGTAAGAAAGPAGAAVGAAAQVAGKAKAAAQSATDTSSGEGGPSGSN